MKIDNRLKTAKYKLLFIMLLFLVPAFFIASFFENNSGYKLLFQVLSALAALFYCFLLFRKLNYFYFTQSNDRFTFRFYCMHPWFRKYQSIEIPIKSFAGFRIENSFGGLRRFLFISAKTPKGVAWYPAISISSLTDTELNNLKEFLPKK